VGNFFFSQILSYGALIQVKVPLNPCVFELGRGGTEYMYTQQNGTWALTFRTSQVLIAFFLMDSGNRTLKHQAETGVITV
jgi:hypothetical protein